MITVGLVKSLINQKLDVEDIFLVDLTVDKLNRIKVVLDSLNGISVGKCIEISRAIESKLDRDIEDYELEVSSPGVDRPFSLPIQFKKNIGRQIEVKTETGNSLKGLLIFADDAKIELETKSKESVNNKKKKEMVTKNIIIEFKEIKSAKVIITF